MKITCVIMTLLAGTLGGFSQGMIQFNLVTPVEKQAIYNVQDNYYNLNTSVFYNGYWTFETIGSSTYQHENPTGSTVYTSAPLSGTGYDAELLIGPAGSTLSQLLPFGGPGQIGGVVLNFNTGPQNIGFIKGAEVITLPTAFGYAAGDVVEVAVAVWNNDGGTLDTLAAAQQANAEFPNSAPWGISNVVPYTLSGLPYPPPFLSGITSFSLGTEILIPEPNTLAFGVMTALTLLFRRRK